MSEEESYSLYDSHHTEGDAHGCHTLCVDTAYKIGVSKIVHTCRKHAYNGRHSHCEYHFMYWGMGEECVIVVLSFHACKSTAFFRQSQGLCGVMYLNQC